MLPLSSDRPSKVSPILSLVCNRRLGQKKLHDGISAAHCTQSRPAAGRALRLQARCPAACLCWLMFAMLEQALTCKSSVPVQVCAVKGAGKKRVQQQSAAMGGQMVRSTEALHVVLTRHCCGLISTACRHSAVRAWCM